MTFHHEFSLHLNCISHETDVLYVMNLIYIVESSDLFMSFLTKTILFIMILLYMYGWIGMFLTSFLTKQVYFS